MQLQIIVCDADQIIQMKIDKLHGNEVTYESGAIENPKINNIIVDILEDTYLVFHNRDCKYFDKSLKCKYTMDLFGMNKWTN